MASFHFFSIWAPQKIMKYPENIFKPQIVHTVLLYFQHFFLKITNFRNKMYFHTDDKWVEMWKMRVISLEFTLFKPYLALDFYLNLTISLDSLIEQLIPHLISEVQFYPYPNPNIWRPIMSVFLEQIKCIVLYDFYMVQ